jgi:triosephosphate isomerase
MFKTCSLIKLGVQNISEYSNGGYTGEISCNMINDFNIKYSLIGHSERRHIFNENNEQIYKKFSLLLNNNIIPVLCVGETIEEYKNKETLNIIKFQIETLLSRVTLTNNFKLIIAYEPVWAIGTNDCADVNDINYVYDIIINILNKYNLSISDNIKILYGGSINEQNFSNILEKTNIDGFLIGKTSINMEALEKIYMFCDKNV